MSKLQSDLPAACFCLAEIIRVTGAQVAGSSGLDLAEQSHKARICTDTRLLKSGDIYLALKGETFDGNDFLNVAIERGAIACITDAYETLAAECEDAEAQIRTQFRSESSSQGSVQGVPVGHLLKVDSSLDAYHQLATHWLHVVSPVVIAVTGSSGKTTTKEMIASVFKANAHTHFSRANENNEIGVAKTILEMPPNTAYLVLEMGMRGEGQIAQLARISSPTVGVITCAGTAHIALLGSEEKIADAKCELLSHLSSGGLAIIGDPSKILMNAVSKVYGGRLLACSPEQMEIVTVTQTETIFRVAGSDQEFRIRARGIHQVVDAWCAIQAGRSQGLSDAAIAEGLCGYQSVEGRGRQYETVSGAVIIDESYNANPESMRCALDAALNHGVFPHQRKIVILGGMAELGEYTDRLHEELGAWLKRLTLTRLYTVGQVAARIADGASGASFEIKRVEKQQDLFDELTLEIASDCLVIVKGSHSARLDLLVDYLVRGSRV